MSKIMKEKYCDAERVRENNRQMLKILAPDRKNNPV